MGDKSPKAAQKNSSQKKAKINESNQQKLKATLDKQAPNGRKK